MRRIAAHLALAAIYASFFAPLLVAQESSLHACCRRTGLHHCQPTNDAGFHSRTHGCPYAMPLPAGTVVGLEPPAKFRVTAPANSRALIQQDARLRSEAAVGDLSARAPPVTLL